MPDDRKMLELMYALLDIIARHDTATPATSEIRQEEAAFKRRIEQMLCKEAE